MKLYTVGQIRAALRYGLPHHLVTGEREATQRVVDCTVDAAIESVLRAFDEMDEIVERRVSELLRDRGPDTPEGYALIAPDLIRVVRECDRRMI